MAMAIGYMRDPVLRLLPSEPPTAFLAMKPAEQAWRGRYFLMTWILTGDEPISWDNALNDEPGAVAEAKRIVESVPDERILAELQAVYAQREEGFAGGSPE